MKASQLITLNKNTATQTIQNTREFPVYYLNLGCDNVLEVSVLNPTQAHKTQGIKQIKATE
jgi:hypothetical protein